MSGAASGRNNTPLMAQRAERVSERLSEARARSAPFTVTPLYTKNAFFLTNREYICSKWKVRRSPHTHRSSDGRQKSRDEDGSCRIRSQLDEPSLQSRAWRRALHSQQRCCNQRKKQDTKTPRRNARSWNSSNVSFSCTRPVHEDVRGPREPSPRGRFPRWPREERKRKPSERYFLRARAALLRGGRRSERLCEPLPSLKVFLFWLFAR